MELEERSLRVSRMQRVHPLGRINVYNNMAASFSFFIYINMYRLKNSQHLQVWGLGSLPENGGLLPQYSQRVAAPSEGGLKEKEVWCSVRSNAGAVADRCVEDGVKLKGKALIYQSI